MNRRCYCPPLRFVLLVLFMCCTTAVASADDLEVFWVRHAEKSLEGEDPGLSPSGAERARSLAALLRDAGIDAIHTTNFRRTRETALPLAQELELQLEFCDPGDMNKLVASLRDRGGRHLVVGHSNTTPRGVELMGGDPGPPIDDATEFDRLYLVTADGETHTILLRY